MSLLCTECLGRGFVYSPGGYAPKLPCPICRVGPIPAAEPAKLGAFCDACQAIPIHGYCKLAGCPMPRPDVWRHYEFFAEGREVMACSDSGGMSIAKAMDAETAGRIAERLNEATSARAEGVAALQQAAVEGKEEHVWQRGGKRWTPPLHWQEIYDAITEYAAKPDHMYTEVERMFATHAIDLADAVAGALSGERTYTQAEVDSILRAAFPLKTPDERAALSRSPLPQQTALVEQGVEKIIAPHEPAACGASAPSEPPRSDGGEG